MGLFFTAEFIEKNFRKFFFEIFPQNLQKWKKKNVFAKKKKKWSRNQFFQEKYDMMTFLLGFGHNVTNKKPWKKNQYLLHIAQNGTMTIYKTKTKGYRA